MRNLLKSFVLLLLAVVMTSGCAGVRNVKNLEVLDCKVESVMPMGLSSASVNFLLKVDNPGNTLALSQMEAVVYKKGEPFCTLTPSDIALTGRTQNQFPLKVVAKLSPEVSLLRLLGIVNSSLEEYTVDVKAKVKVKGAPAFKLDEKGLPVKDLVEKFR